MSKPNTKFDAITKSAEKAIQYNSDPETALMYARRAAEAIAKDLYTDTFNKKPGYLNLHNLIKELSEKKAFPRKVMCSFRVIQNFGNINAHATDSGENIDECLKPALEFFSIILNWYFQDYQKTALPATLKFNLDRDTSLITEEREVKTMPQQPENISPIIKPATPEKTMSNPHYQQDLKILDGVWDMNQVANSETVIILSGCNLVAELLDRPVAEMLRDEIDRLGNPASPKRAIVIADWWWWQEAMDKAHPAIAIGGPSNNGMTRDILEKVAPQGENGLYSAFLFEDYPKVAIWGETGTETRKSVEQFIKNELRSFLDQCWK